jgi:hypothetical protein
MIMKNSCRVDPATTSLTDELKETMHDDEFDNCIDEVQDIDNIIATQQEYEYKKSQECHDLNWWETVDAPAVELGSSRKTPSKNATCYQSRTVCCRISEMCASYSCMRYSLVAKSKISKT